MAIYDPLHRSSNILFDFLDFRHYIGCFCGMFNSAFTVKFQMYALLHIYTISSALPDWVEHIFSLSCKTKLLLTQCKLSTTLLTKSQKISKSLLLLFFPTSLLTSLSFRLITSYSLLITLSIYFCFVWKLFILTSSLSSAIINSKEVFL